jgi:branched-chain amino acid transport system substrate-binding protein
MDGYYAIYPHLGWNDVDHPGVQQARAAFGRGGYPERDRSNTYLLTYSAFYNIAQTLRYVINEYGFEGITGANYLATAQEHCEEDALGYFPINYCGENRSSRLAQIRRATWMGDHIEYVTVQDFFELPDTRPPAP